MKLEIEIEREMDGRWIAEVPQLPGVLAYGKTRKQSLARVKALALRVLAERLEHGESVPEMGEVFSVAIQGWRPMNFDFRRLPIR